MLCCASVVLLLWSFVSVCLSVFLSVCLSLSVCSVSVCLSVCLFACWSLSLYPFVYVCRRLSLSVRVGLSLSLSSLSLSVYVWLSVCAERYVGRLRWRYGRCPSPRVDSIGCSCVSRYARCHYLLLLLLFVRLVPDRRLQGRPPVNSQTEQHQTLFFFFFFSFFLCFVPFPE